MDQIQDYAIHQHRPFVMNHLEAWHARHQRTLEPIKAAVHEINAATRYVDIFNGDLSVSDSADSSSDSLDLDQDMDLSDSDSADSNVSYDYDEIASLFDFGSKQPAEWLRLKEESQRVRQRIANETRQRNRSLGKAVQAPKATKEAEIKRPRGRPRKAGVTCDAAPSGRFELVPRKECQRGRPPKAGVANREAPKRRRGRPLKAEVANREAPKRRRGRPPKISSKIVQG